MPQAAGGGQMAAVDKHRTGPGCRRLDQEPAVEHRRPGLGLRQQQQIVTQSNAADNTALAVSSNTTDAEVAQAAAGTGTGEAQEHGIGNTTDQAADTWITNSQWNIDAPRVGVQPGAAGGAVNQSNSATNAVLGINSNDTMLGATMGRAYGPVPPAATGSSPR